MESQSLEKNRLKLGNNESNLENNKLENNELENDELENDKLGDSKNNKPIHKSNKLFLDNDEPNPENNKANSQGNNVDIESQNYQTVSSLAINLDCLKASIQKQGQRIPTDTAQSKGKSIQFIF